MKDENGYAFELLENNEKTLYQWIYQGIIEGRRIISYGEKYEPLVINKVIKYILLDYPELFWFEGKWGYRELENGMQIGLAYTVLWECVPEYQKRLRKEVEGIVNELHGNEVQKARQLYNWMHENISYGKYTTGQNVKDALVIRDAVCKGMAKAYQLILRQAGIFSVLAEGSIDGTMKHVWNIVRLNEKYYHVDVALGYEEVFTRLGIKKQDASFFGMSDERLNKYCQMDKVEWVRWHCNTDLMEG